MLKHSFQNPTAHQLHCAEGAATELLSEPHTAIVIPINVPKDHSPAVHRYSSAGMLLGFDTATKAMDLRIPKMQLPLTLQPCWGPQSSRTLVTHLFPSSSQGTELVISAGVGFVHLAGRTYTERTGTTEICCTVRLCLIAGTSQSR